MSPARWFPHCQSVWRRRTAIPAWLLAAALLQGCASSSSTQVSAPSPPLEQQRLAQVHAIYRDWRGTPYRYGGESHNGVDCSGLIQLSFQRYFGLHLPRTTRAQAETGQPVARDALIAGDLVFFKTGLFSRHGGIYLEDGRFLHASSSQGVIISSLDTPYWSSHYWMARRP